MPTKGNTPEPLPEISDAEWEVMKVLWDRGALAARDVYEALPDHKIWSIRTVKTLLSRLVAKGAVSYEQIGNSYLYRAAVERRRMERKEVRGFLQRVFDGSLSPVLAHFIEEQSLSDEEVARLKELLRQKGGKGK